MRLYTLSLSGVADAVQQRHPGVLEALELLPDAIKVVLHPPCLIMCVCVCVCEELFFLWLSSICAVVGVGSVFSSLFVRVLRLAVRPFQ